MADLETQTEHELGDHLADPYEAVEREHPSVKEYVRIGLILAVLTALEISASYANVNHAILIPTLWVLSIIKLSLVVMWFMHLRFDDRRYARFFVMGVALASTLYLIVLISFKVFLR
jgi:caa(3)-type oxidase subunit IV